MSPVPFLNNSVLKVGKSQVTISSRVDGRTVVAQSRPPMNKQRKTVPERWSSNGVRKISTQERGGTKRRVVIDREVKALYSYKNIHIDR